MLCTRSPRLGLAVWRCLRARCGHRNGAACADVAAEEVGEGNEIVVTATKREQTLQDVPGRGHGDHRRDASSARRSATSGTCQTVVPSLQRRPAAERPPTPTSSSAASATAPTTPASSLRSACSSTASIARAPPRRSPTCPMSSAIEVLRGPQSTLFGKNASAGVISIVTQEPQFEFGGNVEATYGNYDAMIAQGRRHRAAQRYRRVQPCRRHQQARRLCPGSRHRRQHQRARPLVRRAASCLFETDERFKIRLIGDYDKIDENCCAVVNLQASAATAAIFALVGGRSTRPEQTVSTTSSTTTFNSTNDIENYGFSGQIDYRYRPADTDLDHRLSRDQLADEPGFRLHQRDLIGRNFQDLKINTFTQELRLASDLRRAAELSCSAASTSTRTSTRPTSCSGQRFPALCGLAGPGAFGRGAQLRRSNSCWDDVRRPSCRPVRLGCRRRPIPAGSSPPGPGFASLHAQGRGILDLRPGRFRGRRRPVPDARHQLHQRQEELHTDVVSNECLLGTALRIRDGAGHECIDLAAGGQNSWRSAVGSPARRRSRASPRRSRPPSRTDPGLDRPLQPTTPYVAAGAAVPAAVPQRAQRGRGQRDRRTTISPTRCASPMTSTTQSTSMPATRPASRRARSTCRATAGRPRPTAPRIERGRAGADQPDLRQPLRRARGCDGLRAGPQGQLGLASANVAVFKQEIKGFQSNIFTGSGFVLTNAGKQSTFGIEFEGSVKPPTR